MPRDKISVTGEIHLLLIMWLALYPLRRLLLANTSARKKGKGRDKMGAWQTAGASANNVFKMVSVVQGGLGQMYVVMLQCGQKVWIPRISEKLFTTSHKQDLVMARNRK